MPPHAKRGNRAEELGRGGDNGTAYSSDSGCGGDGLEDGGTSSWYDLEYRWSPGVEGARCDLARRSPVARNVEVEDSDDGEGNS